MKDASTNLTKALPNAGASNTTASLDLGLEYGNAWQRMYIQVDVPALTDHTDTTKTITLTLQDSADGSTFANTSVLIQAQVPGVATSGSLATTFKVPIPPNLRRYIQFAQVVPTGGGTGSNATINYDVVV